MACPLHSPCKQGSRVGHDSFPTVSKTAGKAGMVPAANRKQRGRSDIEHMPAIDKQRYDAVRVKIKGTCRVKEDDEKLTTTLNSRPFELCSVESLTQSFPSAIPHYCD